MEPNQPMPTLATITIAGLPDIAVDVRAHGRRKPERRFIARGCGPTSCFSAYGPSKDVAIRTLYWTVVAKYSDALLYSSDRRRINPQRLDPVPQSA